jgi:hypothetical protein
LLGFYFILLSHSSKNHTELDEFYEEMGLPFGCRNGKLPFEVKFLSLVLGRLGDIYRYLLKTSHFEFDDFWTCALTCYRYAIKIDPLNGIIYNHMVIFILMFKGVLYVSKLKVIDSLWCYCKALEFPCLGNSPADNIMNLIKRFSVHFDPQFLTILTSSISSKKIEKSGFILGEKEIFILRNLEKYYSPEMKT